MAPKPVKDNVSTSSDEYVRAKHNYKGSPADGELSFSKGDVLKVLNKDESGWWKGELNGKTGFFPHNFVVAIAAPTNVVAATPNNNVVVGGGSGGSKLGGGGGGGGNANTGNQGGVSGAGMQPSPAPGPGGANTGGGSVSAAAKAKQLMKGKVGPQGGAGGVVGQSNVVPPPQLSPTTSSNNVMSSTNQQQAPAAQQQQGTLGANSGAAVAAAVAAASQQHQAKISDLERELSERNKGLDVALMEVREARVEVEALKGRLGEQTRRAAEAEQRAQEAEGALQEAQDRCASFEQRALESELMLVRLTEGEGCEDMDLNDLRDLKHKLKSALERVGKVLNEKKACPSCEVAVKDCIVVPCLHAFCHKCGEKNKKQVKCSICGVAPERIYLLGQKK